MMAGQTPGASPVKPGMEHASMGDVKDQLVQIMRQLKHVADQNHVPWNDVLSAVNSGQVSTDMSRPPHIPRSQTPPLQGR